MSESGGDMRAPPVHHPCTPGAQTPGRRHGLRERTRHVVKAGLMSQKVMAPGGLMPGRIPAPRTTWLYVGWRAAGTDAIDRQQMLIAGEVLGGCALIPDNAPRLVRGEP